MSLCTARPVEANRRPWPATTASLHAQPTVPARQIWPHLTAEQQQRVLWTMVVVCRSLLDRLATDSDMGGCDEHS